MENNMENIQTQYSKPLIIVLITMIVLFLLFCGGALLITLEHGWLMGTGWESGISWMWIPALLFLTLSILLGWVIYTKKNVPA